MAVATAWAGGNGEQIQVLEAAAVARPLVEGKTFAVRVRRRG